MNKKEKLLKMLDKIREAIETEQWLTVSGYASRIQNEALLSHYAKKGSD